MLLAVTLGTLVGLAALLAVVGIVLIPAALLARLLRRVDSSEPDAVVSRRVSHELSCPPIWQTHPGA